MIKSEYLQIVRDDLLTRVNGGSILVNESVSIPVQAAAISAHPVVGLQNAIALQIQAPHVTSVPSITKAKLLTATGVVIAEKTLSVQMNGAQFMTLSFVVETKGGV